MSEDQPSNRQTPPPPPPEPPSSSGKQPIPPPLRRHSLLNSTKPTFIPSVDYHQFPAVDDGKSTATTADQEDDVIIVRSPPVKRKFGTNLNEIAPNQLTVSGKGQQVNARSKVIKNKKPPLNPASSSRYDNSLGVLTRKFIDLIKEAKDGTLDLNHAVVTLKIPKRRIYDITNVLEGVGLIEKDSKNRIRWKGEDDSQPEEMKDDVAQLKAEIEGLTVEENALDERIREMEDKIRNLSEDDNNKKLLFVTEDDIKGLTCFQNETLIAITAPYGTALEVPDPGEGVDHSERRYRIILRSTMGPIDVYLVSQFEGKFDDMPSASTSGTNDNPEPVHNMTSEQNMPQDSSGGITKIVNDDPDYWLLPDNEVPLSDMWDINYNIDWDGFDLPNDEFGLPDADVNIPNLNDPPSDAFP